jgi:hypothetical protein
VREERDEIVEMRGEEKDKREELGVKRCEKR